MHNAQARHLHAVDDHEVDTVGAYLEAWLWGKQSLKPSTHAGYEVHVRRHLKPYIGHLPLSGLSPAHVDRMYRLLADEAGPAMSVATLHRLHATLMSALNTAVKRGLIDRNPASTVELPRRQVSRTTTWSAEEFSSFLSAISTHRLHLMFVMLGILGLRRGEAVALRWKDIDLNAGSLRVEQSAVRVKGKTTVSSPKSEAGSRTVAVDDETCRRLGWHAARQRLDLLATTGNKQQPEWVFTTENGQMLNPTWVSREFDRLISRSSAPRIRLHDLRHTSASIGLATGETLLEVSRRLGHSSLAVTADIYSHISPVVAKESAERLSASVYSNLEA